LSAKQKEGLVLSSFAGVGSECLSAKKNGLNFIGFEINPDYIRIAEIRLEREL
jgi:site-specific DNA-methyltransferase (adenine-specific)